MMNPSSMADDVIKRLEGLSLRRNAHESNWRQVQRVAAPDASDFNQGTFGPSSIGISEGTASQRSKDIYDSTAVWCVDRLAAGIEAIVIPQSEYWHTLSVDTFQDLRPDDETKAWLESQRNLLFKVRYDTDGGWVPASQTAIRRMVAFGNGFVMTEESLTNDRLINYSFVPLRECFIACDNLGTVNTFVRPHELTAVQAVAKYGDKVSPQIKKAAEDPSEQDRRFRFVMAIMPREDVGRKPGVLGTPFASIHVEVETRTIVRESGFYEFPLIDFRWLPEPQQEYAEGPVQRALAEIQSLNLMAKNELIAGEQSVKPPLLVANAGVMNRPNSTPNSVTLGGLSPSGEPLVKPMFNGQRLDFATAVKQAKQQQIKESLYINLFQILVNSPEMSATEALLKANEKGELLGPAGSRIEQSLSRMIRREMGVLQRRGLYERGSAYEPPRSQKTTKTAPEFTGPLSRLRQAKEVEGTMTLLNVLSPLAQVNEEVVDNIDPDATARGLADRLGVPREFVRNKDDVAQKREGRQQQQAAAQNAAVAKDMAAAGKQGVEALDLLTNGGR